MTNGYTSPYLTDFATNEIPASPAQENAFDTLCDNDGLGGGFGYEVGVSTKTSAESGSATSGISSTNRTGGDLITGGFKGGSGLLIAGGLLIGFTIIKWAFSK